MELVSIIMPAYNCERYIRQSIDSVLSQTYTNWELLIVDDCSTDSTADIISSYTDPRIHYQRNDQNRRCAYTRNQAIRQAKGRYIAFLDSDDMWKPEKLERQIAFMQTHNYSITYSHYFVLSPNGEQHLHTCPQSLTYFQLTRWNRIGCLTVIYDTVQVGKVFMPAILNREDYAYWLVLLRMGFAAYCFNEPLAVYRSHNGMSGGSKLDLMRYHYIMFHEVLNYPAWLAFLLTLRNNVFYIIHHFSDNK